MSEGLRDRKKRETRQVISDAATRLFILRGFDQVTITEVAAAAGVSKMTVTNYFPRKEDLVFDTHEEFADSLAAAVAARPAGESALAALRRFYADELAKHSFALGLTLPSFAGLLLASPILQARMREMRQEQEDRLAKVLADESGDSNDARAAAAWLTATYRVLFTEALERSAEDGDVVELAAHLGRTAERMFELLEPSLGNYARR